MNILFVSAVLPYPLYSGGQIRIYNLLKSLSSRHAITLYSFIRDREEYKYLTSFAFCKRVETVLRGHAWQPRYIISSIVGMYPLLLASYNNIEMKSRLAEELKTHSYDLIHLEPSYVWPSLPHTDIPTIITEHNIEHTIYEGYVRRFPIAPFRPFLYIDVAKLGWWERHIWRKAMHIIAVSDNDLMYIQQHATHTDVTVVPNGVDIDEFDFRPKKYIPMDAPVFLFVGSFTWMQNRDAVVWLVTSIWPTLRKRYPGATLRIVGRSMPSTLRKLISNHQVMLLEHVESIEEELHNADLLLAPIRIGGGTSFKILEAMASGLPVVTTTLGAAGLNVTHGKEVLIGNTEEELVAAVDMLLASSKKRAEIARNARKTIEQEYAWDNIAHTLDRVWEGTAKRMSL